MKNKRRKFLKSAGSTALFASLGSSFFLSCDDTEDVINPDDNSGNNTSENGFTVDGNTYTIELDHPSFSILKSTGGWLLFNEGGMLLVNVGQDVIRAFSNSCPHAGCRSSWKWRFKTVQPCKMKATNTWPCIATTTKTPTRMTDLKAGPQSVSLAS